MKNTRRQFLRNTAIATTAATLPHLVFAAQDEAAPFRTPYKYPKLILKATGRKGDFDERSIDDPIVFHANGAFYMLYIGWDGIGYQTGLASSTDLLHWKRVALVAPRDPASKFTKYNIALSSILRNKHLRSNGEAIKVNGRYLGAWNAYPSAGYEEGAAVIGLAWSDDLLHWELTDPILYPQDGAPWEHGGLYRPDLMLDRGTYYLYYNAKTDMLPQSVGGGWHEQTGVATSRDLKTWTRYAGNPVLRNGSRGSATYPASNPIHATQPPTPDARDSRFASNPFVVQNGSDFAMFYFGFRYQQPGRACEMLALGADPYTFVKVPEILIDTGAPGSIDETYAHKPSVITHEGVLYHFYCAVSGKWPNETRGIAVARSKPW
ncbi:MAG: hypothetical protein J0G35_16165 [Acidobacteriales bacterium]|nr:hypothetical protein [Terriglobales bacterium]